MKMLSFKEYVAVSVGLAVIALTFFIGGVNPFTAKEDVPKETMTTQQGQGSVADISIEEVTIGTGTEARAGKTVEVHYRLTLASGTEVDSSYGRGQPLPFVLGSGQVVPGFDKAVTGMKVGGKRKVTIPPELGYGSQPVGPIPAHSTLYFEVELVSVK